MAIISDRRAISRGSAKITESVNTKKGKYVSVTQSFDCVKIDVEKPKDCHIPLIKNAWRKYLGQNIARKELPSLFDGHSLDGLSARSAFILFNRIEMTLDNTKNEEKQLDLYLALTAMQKKSVRHLHVRACLSPCSKTLEQKLDALLLKYSHLDAKIKSQDPSSKNDDVKKKPEQKALTNDSLVPFKRSEIIDNKKILLDQMLEDANKHACKNSQSFNDAIMCFSNFISAEYTDVDTFKQNLILLLEKSLIMFNSNVTIGNENVPSHNAVSHYFELLTDTLLRFKTNHPIKEIIVSHIFTLNRNSDITFVVLRAIYYSLLNELRNYNLRRE